jgi:hypothetical protein
VSRKPTPAPAVIEAPMNEAALAEDTANLNQIALIQRETDERVHALALQLNYQGSTDPGALENTARDASEYLGKSIYMLGSCLLLLKEASGHGNFLQALGRIGVSQDSAGRYMAMARRFSNSATSRNLEKLGFSKMTELLPLDDEQINDLTSVGQTGELALDDVATMSVKELRAAVRKERQVKQRLEAVNAELNGEVINLKVAGKVVADTDWPDALKPLADQVAAAGRKLAQALSELEICRITLFEAAQSIPEAQQAKFEAAVGHVADVYQEALARAERGLAKERLTFDKTLGNFGEG